jgi:hypothetical protein
MSAMANGAAKSSDTKSALEQLRFAGWWSFNKTFLAYDTLYRKLHRLEQVDDFVQLKRDIYEGPERFFEDGTVLKPGEAVATLHFNNNYLMRVHSQERNTRRIALAFGGAIVHSMQNLANELNRNPAFSDVPVITGITWFKAHGGKIGFRAEALPESRKKRLLTIHFKILLAALFPVLAKREAHRLEPHQFWLTRRQLFNTVNEDNNYVAQRLTRHR